MHTKPHNIVKRSVRFGLLLFFAIGLLETTALAQSDTLMYNSVDQIYVNPTDAAGFVLQTEDLDGLVPDPVTNVPGNAFDMNSSTSPGDLFPGDNGTAYFYSAASLFTPWACCADNWLEFGPVTIPTQGAWLSWTYRGPEPFMQDGYAIYLSKTGMDNHNSFTNQPIFTKGDNLYVNDTNWYHKQVFIDGAQFAGPLYFGFHHSTSIFRLDLDNIMLTKSMPTATGITEGEEQTLTLNQNYPNPASDYTEISYTLFESAPVTLEVMDLTGKVVVSQNEGTLSEGQHRIGLNTTELTSGVYIYRLTAGDIQNTQRLTVVR
jgi:hypothetical protein